MTTIATNPPTILVTNDDGIDSPGLRAAAECVLDLGNVIVVAPNDQQTSMSRSFPKRDGIGRIWRRDFLLETNRIEAYAVDGSPALAVSHAVLEICQHLPDLCISGINLGENVGAGLNASGTIGAALEAYSYGIPALAASLQMRNPFTPISHDDYPLRDWKAARHFVHKIAERILTSGLPPGTAAINLNIPSEADEDTPIRRAVQSEIEYYSFVRPRPRDYSEPFYFDVEVRLDDSDLEEDSDIKVMLFDREVAITPLTWSIMAHTEIDDTWLV